MAKKVWRNHEGQEVPFQYVPKIDKTRERVALKIHKKAMDINKRLSTFKDEAFKAADEVFEEMMADANIRVGEKGNYSITTFDKEIKIEVDVQEKITFSDEIQVAYALIQEYIKEKTDGVDHELVQLVNQAFKTRKGNFDTKRILGLFELDIRHKKWLAAMDEVKKSISRSISKRYMKIWEMDQHGEYKAVVLNFSSI